MDAQRRGDLSESRFFQAVRRLAQEQPQLVRGIRRASPGLDARGVDAIVTLVLPKGSAKDDMSVPCEIKSSKSGVVRWRVKHPEHNHAGVLVFFIRDDMPNAAYRKLFVRAFRTVRNRSRDGTLFHSWFQSLFRRPLSPRGKDNVRKIKARRNAHQSRSKPPSKDG